MLAAKSGGKVSNDLICVAFALADTIASEDIWRPGWVKLRARVLSPE